jgi:hypothetical protein
MLAHRITKPIEIPAGGARWRIAFTHRALLDIEELTGMGAMQVNLANLSAGLLRAVLFAVLREAGAATSITEAGEILRPGAVPKIRALLIEAWTASMPETDRDDEEEPSTGNAAEPLTTLDAWAKARYDLRLSDDDWLSMTPRMVYALSKRRLESARQFELMVGVLCAHTVNHSFHAPRNSTNPRSYMLHPWPERASAHSTRVTGETVMTVFADLLPKPKKGKSKP